MTWCSPITRKTIVGAVLLSLLHCGSAMAQERKIYKSVDEKGNTVYSQVPPMSGASVKKLNMEPAYIGLGGYGGYGIPVWPYDDLRNYYQQEQYNNALRQRQQQTEDARNKRLAELEAECNRSRGTDCSDPETLRYIESTKVPRVYPYSHRDPYRR